MRLVITGGPSVGKTTIVSRLEAQGFTVVHEQATQIIKEGQFLPWVDRQAFQCEVLRRQLAAEASLLENKGPVFLDRGLFDGEAYYIYDKLDVPSVFNNLDASQYSLAFLIEELPFFDANEVRRENLAFTREITRILEWCYASRNVPVIRVPAMSPVERVEFVLKFMQEKLRQEVVLPSKVQETLIPRAAIAS